MKLYLFPLMLCFSGVLGSINVQSGRGSSNQNLYLRLSHFSTPQSPLDKHLSAKREINTPSKTQLRPRKGDDGFEGPFGGGNDGFSSGSNSGSEGFGGFFEEIEQERETYRLAHGVIMSAVVLLLFPIGALAMRLLGKWWLHAAFQIFSILALIAGFGLGVYMAQHERRLFNNTHTIFGTVLVALFATAQPIIGFLQHRHFRNYKARGVFGYMHLWLGRILIVLGVVNGGLGLKLSDEEGKAKTAYIAIAAVVGSIYILTLMTTALLKRRGSKAGSVI